MKRRENTVEHFLLQKFEVEELEKRYEFGWSPDVKTGASYNGYGGSVTFATS